MKKIDFVILAILGILLILPAFIAENKYPFSAPINDFKNDVNRAEQAKIGGNVHDTSNHYMGRTIMAYTVGGISSVTGISCESIQKWANYILLFLSCSFIYIVISLLFGRIAGVLASIITFFSTHSFFTLFSAGDIWNIIEVCILLVPMLYFLTKWLANRKKLDLGLMLSFLALFSLVHPLALVIPYIMGAFFGCYIIYKIMKRQYKEAGKLTALIVGMVAGNIILSTIGIKDALSLHYATIFGTVPTQVASNPIIVYGTRVPMNIFTFIYQYISLPTLGLLCIVAATLTTKWKEINLKLEEKPKAKWFLLLLASFIIPFTIATFSRVNLDTTRHAMDSVTLIAIGTGCLAGLIIRTYKSNWLYATTAILLATGIVPILVVWFGTQGK